MHSDHWIQEHFPKFHVSFSLNSLILFLCSITNEDQKLEIQKQRGWVVEQSLKQNNEFGGWCGFDWLKGSDIARCLRRDVHHWGQCGDGGGGFNTNAGGDSD